MGEFSSGRWIVGLAIYFFAIFVLIYSTVGASLYYGTDINGVYVNDPGFNSANNNPLAQGGLCDGTPYGRCASLGADTQEYCEAFSNLTTPGLFEIGGHWFFPQQDCYWDNSTNSCKGTMFALTCDGNFTTNQALCEAVDCTWTDFTTSGGVSGDTFDWGKIKATIGFLSGMSYGIGIPAGWHFLFAFIFVWLPSFMLLWAIYMALPFLH